MQSVTMAMNSPGRLSPVNHQYTPPATVSTAQAKVRRGRGIMWPPSLTPQDRRRGQWHFSRLRAVHPMFWAIQGRYFSWYFWHPFEIFVFSDFFFAKVTLTVSIFKHLISRHLFQHREKWLRYFS
jgi:hypothetical protein